MSRAICDSHQCFSHIVVKNVIAFHLHFNVVMIGGRRGCIRAAGQAKMIKEWFSD
jgi:hypothetical protein